MLTHENMPVGKGTEMKRDQLHSGGMKTFPTLMSTRISARTRRRPSTKTVISSMPIARLFSQRIQTRNMRIISIAPKLIMERAKMTGGRRHAYPAASITWL